MMDFGFKMVDLIQTSRKLVLRECEIRSDPVAGAFYIKMMIPPLKVMLFPLKMMIPPLKMMLFPLKMMIPPLKMTIFVAATSPPEPALEGRSHNRTVFSGGDL